MRHLLSPLDFSVEELDNLMDLAKDIEANPKKYAHACEGKKLATLFYEPSTRTRLSHEAAMINLGGSVLGFSSADSSSASKGESVADTIRVISCFADICAMRHPKEGAAMVASQHATIPVINAGDEEDYVRMKDFYILDNKKMELAKDDMYILHPLPRVNEIATEVDNDPRAAYFKQVQYGVYIRMALILTLLGIEV